MKNVKNILITGASSGLGEALALAYARKGATLILTGRNQERLARTAQKVEQLGGKAVVHAVDVRQKEAMDALIKKVDQEHPLDLVIANAGISAGTAKGEESSSQSRSIFETNLDGVLYTLWPVIPLMKERGRGQIAIMSSLAGFRGLAGAPSYGASKAAVRVYGEALRDELAPHGIGVNVICPGFVKTPMTDVNSFKMPFLMETDKAARIIKRGLDKNSPRIAFPWPMVALVWLLSSLPPRVTSPLLTRMPRKR